MYNNIVKNKNTNLTTINTIQTRRLLTQFIIVIILIYYLLEDV
jgi:hypothetical protein